MGSYILGELVNFQVAIMRREFVHPTDADVEHDFENLLQVLVQKRIESMRSMRLLALMAVHPCVYN